MAGIVDAVRKSIDRHTLVSPGDLVVVGVSGGPDSLCLLHVLHCLRTDYQYDLHVAHLHHGLRGDESDADAEAVRAFAADWGLPFSLEHADIPALAREHRMAIEETSRRVRYGYLGRVAGAIGSHCVAVGHNADDQAETVLMHWIRGAGLAGLRGMLPVTSLAEYRLIEADVGGAPSSAIRLIRPLLGVPRSEIEAYCALHGLEPCFDRSNLDRTYFRNWLRHEVLPLLASHNPNIREVICRSARVLADDYALLRTAVVEAWRGVVAEETAERIVFDLAKWRTLPASLQRSTLREAVQRLRRSLRDVGFVHVENAVEVARSGTAGAQSTLPRGLVLALEYEHLIIASAGATSVLPNWPLLAAVGRPVPVCIPGATTLRGSRWRLEAQVVARSDLPSDWESNKDQWRAFVDASEVRRGLRLRTRKPGDRFQPLGMGGRTVKLSDFLTNRKVPLTVRDRLPVLVSDSSIVWVCGHHIDERARIRASTREALLLCFVQDDAS